MRTALLLAASAVALWAGTAQAQAQANCPVKLGATVPLSAPGSVTGGEAMRDAIRIAEAEINKAGGVLGCPVQVVIVDDEGLPERGRAVMERLITQDRVVAVGGGTRRASDDRGRVRRPCRRCRGRSRRCQLRRDRRGGVAVDRILRVLRVPAQRSPDRSPPTWQPPRPRRRDHRRVG